jgi:hypothetical protein
MEKYRLVQEHKAEDSHEFLTGTESSNVPEVRITQQGKPRNYITYALQLFVSIREKELCRLPGAGRLLGWSHVLAHPSLDPTLDPHRLSHIFDSLTSRLLHSCSALL